MEIRRITNGEACVITDHGLEVFVKELSNGDIGIVLHAESEESLNIKPS